MLDRVQGCRLTAVAGDNEIVLNELSDGSYTDCELKVRDSVGNTATLSLVALR